MYYRQVCALSVGLAVFTCTALPQAGPSPTTAEELVQAALTRNRDFLAVQQRIVEAQGLLRQAGIRPAPTFEVEGTSGRPLGTVGEEEFSAGYFYTIETGGKRDRRVAVAGQSLKLARAELSQRTRDLTLQVKSRLADAVSEARKAEALERLLKTNQEYLRLTQARVKEGDAAPLEALLLETDLNRARSQQAASEGRARGALLQLQVIVSMPPTQTVNLSFASTQFAEPSGLKELQSLALANRPDLETVRVLERQTEEESLLAKADAHPNLTLSGRYAYRTSAFDELGLNSTGGTVPLRDRDNVVSVGISIPLTGTRRSQGNIQAAQARQTSARLRREYLESAIPIQVEAAFERWQSAKKALDILNLGVVTQSEKNLEVVRQAYALGQLRLLDVLNEQRRLIDTELAYIDAQTEQYRAYAKLEQAAGGPIR